MKYKHTTDPRRLLNLYAMEARMEFLKDFDISELGDVITEKLFEILHNEGLSPKMQKITLSPQYETERSRFVVACNMGGKRYIIDPTINKVYPGGSFVFGPGEYPLKIVRGRSGIADLTKDFVEALGLETSGAETNKSTG